MFRLHLFIKKQAHTARKGSVGLNNNVAQFETDFDTVAIWHRHIKRCVCAGWRQPVFTVHKQ